MNCPYCQAPLREGATFCTQCGKASPLAAPSQAPLTPAPSGQLGVWTGPGAGAPVVSSQPPVLPSAPGSNAPVTGGRPTIQLPPVISGGMPGSALPPTQYQSPSQPIPTTGYPSPGMQAWGNAPTQATPSSGNTGPGQPVTPYSATIQVPRPVNTGPGLPPAGPITGPGMGTPTPPAYASGPVGSGYLPGASVYDAPPPHDPYSAAPVAAPPPPPLLLVFGPDTPASAAEPRTRIQRALRNFSPRYAVNKWFTGALGALAALVTGLILTAIIQGLFSTALGDALTFGSGASSSSIATISSFLKIDVLNLFALEHLAALVVHVGAGGVDAASLDLTINLPFLGLLLVPALALTLGGMISASSDYHRLPYMSIARGALMGPIYAVVLFVVAQFSSSTVSLGAQDVSASVSLGPSTLQECLYGLLWGLLFGALGGWIQLKGRATLAAALPALQALKRPRLVGGVAGALAALLCGILMFTIAGLAVGVYFSSSFAATAAPTQQGAPALFGSDGLWALLRLLVLLGPTAAIWAFALGVGGPITLAASGSGGSSLNTSLSYGLINAQKLPGNNLWYLLVVIPILCCLIGGHIAARVNRSQQVGDGFAAGAMIALPLALLLSLMALLVTISVGISGSGGLSALGFNGTSSIGPAFGGTFLGALVVGAVAGGLGGASTAALPSLGTLPRLLVQPFRPLRPLLNRLLDSLLARPHNEPFTPAGAWFYDGILLAAGLGLVVLALDLLSLALTSVLPFVVLRNVDEWGATLLVGLPLLFFVGALVAAFSSPAPQPALQSASGSQPIATSAPPAWMYAAQQGVSQPFAPGLAQPTGGFSNQTQPSTAAYPGVAQQPQAASGYVYPTGAQPLQTPASGYVYPTGTQPQMQTPASGYIYPTMPQPPQAPASGFIYPTGTQQPPQPGMPPGWTPGNTGSGTPGQ
jgi:hypothetical protein